MRFLLLLSVVVVVVAACPPPQSEGEGEGGEGEGEGEGEPVDEGCKTGAFTWPVEQRDVPITASDAFKTRLAPFDGFEPFVRVDFDAQASKARTAKAVVLVEDPDTVYFQDSNVEAFHTTFATAHLDPFVGLSAAEFDAVSLREAGQQAILVTLFFPADPSVHEVGVQLARAEPYHAEQALTILRLLQDNIDAPTGTKFFYTPSPDQQACAAGPDVAAYEDAGFDVTGVDRFVDGAGACYAEGWAVGRLVHVVDSATANVAFARGDLSPEDVLLIDGVPERLPSLAGVLTFTASTPVSQVAVRANETARPFAAVFDDAERQRLLGLVGQTVLVQTAGQFGGCHAEVFDGALLPVAEQERLLASRPTTATTITPPAAAAAAVVNVGDLDVDDRATVGAAAADASVVVRNGAAVTFFVFDEFFDAALDAVVVANDPPLLRQLIAAHRIPDDVAASLLPSLADVFGPTQPLRFRPSTNAVDDASFVAAGLYADEFGCVADDLDDDDAGPSACDDGDPDEHGALAALVRVYVDAFNDAAIAERAARGIDEADVRMGALVTAAAPDDDVIANGVAVLRDSGFGANVELFVQPGAASVREATSRPEHVRVDVFGGGAFVTLLESSSTLPLGATLLEHDPNTGVGDYSFLGDQLQGAADRWRAAHGLADDVPFVVEVEFEQRRSSGALVVTSIGALPRASDARVVPVAVLPSTSTLCPFEGESSDAFAIHRAKSRIQLTMQGRVLDDEGSAAAFIDAVAAEFVVAGASVDDDFADLDEAAFAVDGTGTHHSFRVADRVYEIATSSTEPQSLTRPPFRALDQTGLLLVTRTDDPVAFYGFDDVGGLGLSTRSEEVVTLVPCTLDDDTLPGEIAAGDRGATSPDGEIVVVTDFYWPPPPTGVTAGYTAPTVRWGTSTIRGLIAQDIVLTSSRSQTSRPEHHNFGTQLLFEPRLEPAIDPAIVSALAAIDVIALHIDSGGRFFAIGADGSIRPVGGTTLP